MISFLLVVKTYPIKCSFVSSLAQTYKHIQPNSTASFLTFADGCPCIDSTPAYAIGFHDKSGWLTPSRRPKLTMGQLQQQSPVAEEDKTHIPHACLGFSPMAGHQRSLAPVLLSQTLCAIARTRCCRSASPLRESQSQSC